MTKSFILSPKCSLVGILPDSALLTGLYYPTLAPPDNKHSGGTAFFILFLNEMVI